MDWQIAGHKKQLEMLSKSIASGKVAHGYIFAGPDGVGKKTIARKLAQELLGPIQSVQPDLIELDGAQGIKIEQIRELIYKLSLRPFAAMYKIAIIDAADAMTLEAANALLKSLEEPKPHTIIILITSNPNKLPKTILSRAQKITFGPVALSEYEYLLPNKISAEQKKMLDTLTLGRPGVALKLLSDADFAEATADTQARFGIFSSNNLADRLLGAAEIAELETIEIKTLLETWLVRVLQDFRRQPTLNIKNRIDQLALAQKQLDQNVNTKLLLTNLMLNT